MASEGGSRGRTPRPYQVDGVNWLRDGGRAVLTDGFGLGKTAQAIWAAEGPTLVSCPGHLIAHWVREIRACLPDARVVAGDAARVSDRMIQLNDADADDDADFYVSNIELLRTEPHKWFEPLRGRRIVTWIIDESHRLRGHTSKQYKAAEHVAALVPRVYELTATPVYNQPDDLYGQLRLLDPTKFTSYYTFMHTYLKVWHTSFGPKVLGLNKNRELKKVFARYALGRTREEVKAQLPVLQETLIEIDAGVDFYKTYRTMKATYRDQYARALMTPGSLLEALRSLTQQAKVQTAVQLVLDSGAKDTLIYTYHKDLARAIGYLLKIPVITGDMPPGKREAVARAHDLIVATFPSVAEGVDLSHIQNVIYVEHDWVPGMMAQSLARVHRPTSPYTHTNVYHVVVKKTADSVIYGAFRGRGKTMQEVIDAALVEWTGGDGEDNAEEHEGTTDVLQA